MNHDEKLKNLGIALKIVLISYESEISQLKDPKHRAGLIQEFDKARHFMLKMTKCMDDMNCWFSAFGADGNAKDL